MSQNSSVTATPASAGLSAGRRLLIDLGNTKTALAISSAGRILARTSLATSALSEEAINSFLIPEAQKTASSAFTVRPADYAELATAIADANRIALSPATATDNPPAGDGAASFTGKIPAGRTLDAPQDLEVFVSSVVPPWDEPLRKWLTACPACRKNAITFADPARREILPHRLETPETTGSDRLLAALAAFSRPAVNPKKEAVVIVQAGSAAVVDLVDKNGVFHGGMIMPGPKMWLQSLASAAKLPLLNPDAIAWDSKAPGTSTASAILNGAACGLIGQIKEAVRRLLMALPGQVPLLVFTGGWGEKLLPFFPGKYYSDLVLQGLDCFADKLSRENASQKG